MCGGDVDLLNRDPNEINSHLRVAFEDVLAEPDGVRSLDCIWSCSYKCFECAKNCWYGFLTLLCGTCIAFAWGCDFAATSFNHIWCYTPCMRDFSICVGFFQKVFGTLVNCCCAPICETCGLCLSRIVIKKS